MIDGIKSLYEELIDDGGIIIGVIVEENLRHYVIGRAFDSYSNLQLCSIGKNYCNWTTRVSINKLKTLGWFDMVDPIIKHYMKHRSILVVDYNV